MPQVAGVTIEKDLRGKARYMKIDMKQHGSNELIEDFIDIQEAESRINEDSVPFDEFIKKEEKRRNKYAL